MLRLELEKLNRQTIVITGASSGIGLATAEMAAARGARVVLSSRNEEDLRHAADRIRARGGEATFFVADVADEHAMRQLAEHAVKTFRRLDTWVNNAGISIYGRLDEVPLEEKRRLFDVNFWGVVHGCRAALPHLRQRGGAIINIGSILSDTAIPLQGMYGASKHAVKGYTDALRIELAEEGAPIAVTLVKPASIDTMFPEHARSHMDAEPTLPPPVYAPEVVARTILHCAEHPIREITVGGAGKLMTLMRALTPRLHDVYMERTMFSAQKKSAPSDGRDSLYRPQQDGSRRGSDGRWALRSSLYTRAALSDVGRALPLVAIGAAAAAALGRRESRADAPAA